MGSGSSAGIVAAVQKAQLDELSAMVANIPETQRNKLLSALGGRSAGAVILDCDGTLLDTEKLRSEVTFLLLAPFMPGLAAQEGSFTDWKENYILTAAGRSFKQKGEDVDDQRREARLPAIAESWNTKDVQPEVMEPVIAARTALGIPAVPGGAGLQEAKWEEDRIVLETCSEPCKGMRDVILAFRAQGIPFNIASTSSRPSLNASIAVAGMTEFFEPEVDYVHSGESDFDPPRHKPKPDVYLKAAAALGVDPKDCVAVEDSDSGVGSAAHAGMGLIVGYVGGGQIPFRQRDFAAEVLMEGGRSENLRGADVVISEARALTDLVVAWRSGLLVLPLERAAVENMISCKEELRLWLPLEMQKSQPTVQRNKSSVAEMG